jgi:hypothetical protein
MNCQNCRINIEFAFAELLEKKKPASRDASILKYGREPRKPMSSQERLRVGAVIFFLSLLTSFEIADSCRDLVIMSSIFRWHFVLWETNRWLFFVLTFVGLTLLRGLVQVLLVPLKNLGRGARSLGTIWTYAVAAGLIFMAVFAMMVVNHQSQIPFYLR